MGVDYIKATEFELDPHIKSHPYEDSNIELNPSYVYNNNAHISIDGERYKSQKFKGKVLPRCFPVLF